MRTIFSKLINLFFLINSYWHTLNVSNTLSRRLMRNRVSRPRFAHLLIGDAEEERSRDLIVRACRRHRPRHRRRRRRSAINRPLQNWLILLPSIDIDGRSFFTLRRNLRADSIAQCSFAPLKHHEGRLWTDSSRWSLETTTLMYRSSLSADLPSLARVFHSRCVADIYQENLYIPFEVI